MKSQIFINLPVKDLAKAMDFYTKIGFTNNPQFTDETAACMVFSEEIFVMLLTHEKFKYFIVKEIADTSKTTEVINSLSLESTEKMNDMADKAVKAGAVEYSEPKDYGFMQQRSFEDPDGHCWEVFYMDISKFPKQ
ncbi:lactoylglutathione lyase [Flavobacterium limnosediminis JC2902]|uniref:Lactoylglutathione lyase n=1 Tax=Flavobacterium limnosediminis JC2902 TaxID=1341181 RepID=V6SL66_9FLAO|nr:VOC family protein [Flavobacterium limnosediminis]ESU27012.1 lactoylglutathione lyase [Flavobacterium limnosediminis JC2902]